MSTPTEAYPAITGVGMALPERVVDNNALAAALQGTTTSDEAVRRLVGIETRHWANLEAGEITSGFANTAAQAALEMAGRQGSDLDDIYVATASPDTSSPSVSSRVHHAVSASETCGAVDINAACAGGVVALMIATGMMQHNEQSAALVAGAEVLSTSLDLTDRRSAILFGDGAGAVTLENRDSAVKPTFVRITRPDAEAIYEDRQTKKIVMEGPRVAGHASYVMPTAALRAAQKAGLADSEGAIDWTRIDHIIPHQANLRMMEGLAKALDAPEDKFVSASIVRHGNTSAASIFLAMTEAYKQGQIEGGQRTVLFTAIGAGMVGAAGVMSLDLPKLG